MCYHDCSTLECSRWHHVLPDCPRWLRYLQMAPVDSECPQMVTCGYYPRNCFTGGGNRFSVLPGLLQIALDDSRWHHVLPDWPRWPRYPQMSPDDSKGPEMTTRSYYPGKLFYSSACGRFCVLPGLLQITLVGSRWRHARLP